jgi:ADP-heptose:LPS heptosyltransferase
VENFLAAGGALRRRYGGTLVIIGGPEEVLQAEWLKSLAGPPCLNLAGSTPLATLGAVIARLTVLITTDSGPAHVAYALKTPTVTIFGGADPLRYGPPVAGPFRALVHPVPCRPCADPLCPIDLRCLTGIAVEEAVAAAQQVMAQSAPRSLPQSPPSASRKRARLSVS